MLNYIKSYCHILAKLPGILARLERELQGKASAMSVAMNSASINSLENRVATKPNQADLTALHSILGGRLDTLEAQVGPAAPTANLRREIRSSIANAVANVEAAKLEAMKTGEPNFRKAIFDMGGIKLDRRKSKMVAIDKTDTKAVERANHYNEIADRQAAEALHADAPVK